MKLRTSNAEVRISDRLADALSYPAEGYAATIDECWAAVSSSAPRAAGDMATFEAAIRSMPLEALQELYARTFDFDPRSTLDVGWHVFGESHDRGMFLAAVRAELSAAGVPETLELPDHLTQLLRLIGRCTPERALEIAALVSLALDRIVPALEADQNPYAPLLRAVRAWNLEPGSLNLEP